MKVAQLIQVLTTIILFTLFCYLIWNRQTDNIKIFLIVYFSMLADNLTNKHI